MAKIDELHVTESEIRDCNNSISQLRREIYSAESKKSEESLKDSFLEENRPEINLMVEEFERKISQLEKKRDEIYAHFKKEAEIMLKDYGLFCKKFYEKQKPKEDKQAKKREKERENQSLKNRKLLKSWRFDKLAYTYLVYAYQCANRMFINFKEKRRITKMLHDNFIEENRLDELQIAMIDKKWGYKRKINRGLYAQFIERFKLDENQKIVFDDNKFNKIDDLPEKVYINIDNGFLEDNPSRFTRFSNDEKDRIDKEIRHLESEIEDDQKRLQGLESDRNWTKQRICPKCHGNKSSTHKYCSGCWIKIRRGARSAVYTDEYNDYDASEEIDEKEPRYCEVCGKTLKTRRKYCSDCRPSYRLKPFWAPKEERFKQYEQNRYNVQRARRMSFFPRMQKVFSAPQTFRQPRPMRIFSAPIFRSAPRPLPPMRPIVALRRTPQIVRLRRNPRIGW